MKTAPVARLKARLSEYLRLVKRGEEVIVLERGRPIARILPIPPGDKERDELIRLGVLRPGRGRISKELIERLPVGEDPEGKILDTLLEEREAGR
ncbi:MAG: type II toxin-antitoxin system prevent-host-death family antitoxin [Planctomycetes bacterium]|nr:type II toxin-antitoxin system prevent-host-death family antitoxin [Planctomycetota bacterium]